MNIKLDKSPSLQEIFSDSTEFFKYLRKTMILLKEDTEKNHPQGKSYLTEIIPDIVEFEYMKDLKRPRLVFPKLSNKIIIQLPGVPSPQKEGEDVLFYSPIIKAIEADFTVKLSIITKLFDSKIKETDKQARK